MLLHGLAGCAAAAAAGGDCAAGAAGAVAQSIYAGYLTGEGGEPDRNDVLKRAEFIGALAGFLFSGGKSENVDLAAMIGRSGIENNYLYHAEQLRREKARLLLEKCQAAGVCTAAEMADLRDEVAYFDGLDAQRDADVKNTCDANPSGAACIAAIQEALEAVEYLRDPRDALMLAGDALPGGYSDLEMRLKDGRFGGLTNQELAAAVYAERTQTIELLKLYPASVQQALAEAGNRSLIDAAIAAASLGLELKLGGGSTNGGAKGAGTALETTNPIVVSGSRAIDKAQSYERGVREMYGGSTAFEERQFRTVVDGKIVYGVADEVAVIGGKKTAIEAKFVDDWGSSIRNPASPAGSTPWSVAEQTKMVDQAKKYSSGFDGGAIYHTNSPEMASYYSKVFTDAGVTNFKFVITPTAK